MNKKERLEALISYYSKGNKTAFASIIGMKPQSINSWLIRDTFDIELIYSKCNGISAEWLLSGEGPMLKEAGGSASENQDPRLWSLIESQQRQLEAQQKQLDAQTRIIEDLTKKVGNDVPRRVARAGE